MSTIQMRIIKIQNHIHIYTHIRIHTDINIRYRISVSNFRIQIQIQADIIRSVCTPIFTPNLAA